ncbi:glycosyltransferase [Microbacterium xylanilyticum]
MKVLRIAHHGVVTPWRERERQLRRLGEDVSLVSARRWNEGGRPVAFAAEGDDFVTVANTVGTHPNAFLYDPRPLWRALGSRPDLIDLHEEPFSLATAEVLLLRAVRRVRAPYVLYSAQNLDKRYPVPFRWFERWALRGAAGAYVCNREAGEILERKGLRGPAVLIPLGVDMADFSPRPRDTPSDVPVIGYVGRLEPNKGVSVLLRSAALRDGWRVEITGDGPQRQELQRLAADLGIEDRVSFRGFAQGAALAEAYRRLDVVVVPSLPWPGWREQFCRVAVEAMASGVPVVASSTGAIPDVVDRAGVLVPPDDPDALAAGVDEALDPDRWRALRAEGLERAAEFTWERVAEQQQRFYADTTARDGGRGGHPPQVVAVAYGDPDMLAGAVDALGGGFSVTIVDNSSSARTRELAQRHGAVYLDPGRNLGFGGGVNAALRSLAERGLAGDDVLLLNPDARIPGREVERMCAVLRADIGIAAVGATQTDPDGHPARVWWPFPTPWRAWMDAVGLGRWDRAHGFAIGSVLLLRAEAIARVGMFDERFFLYAEEVDWQKRAVAGGWRIEVAAVEATHVGGGTSGNELLREALFFASTETYQRKHAGAPGWFSFRVAMIVGAAIRIPLLRGERRAGARRRLRIFWEGPVRYRRRFS